MRFNFSVKNFLYEQSSKLYPDNRGKNIFGEDV